MNKKKSIHIFFKKILLIIISKRVWPLSILLSCYISISLLSLINPILSRYLISQGILKNNIQFSIMIMIVMFFVVLGALLLQTIKNIILSIFFGKIYMQFQKNIFYRLLCLPITFFHHYIEDDIINRMLGTTILLKSMANINIFISIIFSMMSLIFMFFLIPMLTLFILVLIFFIFLAYGIFLFIQFSFFDKAAMERRKVNVILHQMIANIRKIKVLGRESIFLKNYTANLKHAQYYQRFSDQVNAWRVAFFESALLLSLVIMFTFFSFRTVSLDVFIAFNTCFLLLLSSVLSLKFLAEDLIKAKIYFNRIKPFLSYQPEIRNLNQEDKVHITGNIEFKKVDYLPEDEKKYVLHDLNLKINSGEFLVVTGKNGSGKTSILKLILGLITPAKGNIFFENKLIDEYNLPDLRRTMGSVLEKNQFFSGNVYENINMDRGYSEEAVWEILRTLEIDRIFSQLPQKLMTLVSNKTTLLSYGEKQLILLARALIGNPTILLLDEATSALDDETQDKILSFLKRIPATKIIVTQRIDALHYSDRIVFLENGRIVEDGSFEDLLIIKKKFFNFFCLSSYHEFI